MSARDRIIALLRTHPTGLDDDVIAEKLGLSRRRQANSRCRELERDGIVERRSVGALLTALFRQAENRQHHVAIAFPGHGTTARLES